MEKNSPFGYTIFLFLFFVIGCIISKQTTIMESLPALKTISNTFLSVGTFMVKYKFAIFILTIALCIMPFLISFVKRIKYNDPMNINPIQIALSFVLVPVVPIAIDLLEKQLN